MNCTFKRFESVEEFLDAAEPSAHYGSSASPWYNNETAEQAASFTRSGNNAVVAEAEKLIEQLSDVTDGEPVRTWQPSISGAYPIVPEFLAGHPLYMRMRQESEIVTPVSIYCCTTSSGGITAKQYMRRGAAILALVMMLQKRRPVDLYITFECDNGQGGAAIHAIPIPSRPLNISQAAYALSSTGFSRHLTYGYAMNYQGSGLGWVPGYGFEGKHTAEYLDCVKNAYGLQPNDIHLPPIGLMDELLNKPVDWLNKQIARYNGAAQ